MTKTEYGNANDLIEDMNGGPANIIYLINRDYNEIVNQYNQIKASKAIISAYSIGPKHCLVLRVDGIIRKKVIKRKILGD